MNKITKQKVRRDTHSNRLKTEKQVALALSLKEEDLLRRIKNPAATVVARSSVEGYDKSTTIDAKKDEGVLPPIGAALRGKTSSANPQIKQSKYLRKNFPVDIAVTLPRGSLADLNQKKQLEKATLHSAFAPTRLVAASSKTVGGIDMGQLRA